MRIVVAIAIRPSSIFFLCHLLGIFPLFFIGQLILIGIKSFFIAFFVGNRFFFIAFFIGHRFFFIDCSALRLLLFVIIKGKRVIGIGRARNPR